MTSADDSDGVLTPDDAFAVLGDETRLAILRALGEADGPVAFSDLYDAVDVDDSGQFNYHLDRLVGHFVRKIDAGYHLREPGRQVVEAVLSGVVTDTPTFDRTRVDQTCEYCGSTVEAQWRAGNVELYCTGCAGRYGRRHDAGDAGDADEGYLGRLTLPPAGVRGRDADEIVRTAWTWTNLEVLAFASGICPRCSATVEYDLSVCWEHETDEGLCQSCDRYHAITVGVSCTNCIYYGSGAAALALLSETAVLDFLTDHGLDPIAPGDITAVNSAHEDYEEAILETDPLEARLTLTVDGDRLALTVDDSLTVLETTRLND
jgi:hypothetical protein